MEPRELTPIAPSFFLATPTVALSINAQAGLELHFLHSSPPWSRRSALEERGLLRRRVKEDKIYNYLLILRFSKSSVITTSYGKFITIHSLHYQYYFLLEVTKVPELFHEMFVQIERAPSLQRQKWFSLDWLMKNSSNPRKVVEGQYEGEWGKDQPSNALQSSDAVDRMLDKARKKGARRRT